MLSNWLSGCQQIGCQVLSNWLYMFLSRLSGGDVLRYVQQLSSAID